MAQDLELLEEEIGGLDDQLDISEEQLEAVQEIIADPLLFISNVLQIQNKLGQLVPLVFNEPQMRLYQEIKRQQDLGMPVRIIILKARQMGFSTATAGLFYHRTVTNTNTNTMIIAHKADASTNIFNKNKLFFEKSPAFLQPMRKASNAKELIFENPTTKASEKRARPGLRSKIVIETAMNKEAARSWTLQNVHISELAFWPYPAETLLSVQQAVPNQPGTCIIIESTANGVGGTFYEEWLRAERGESAYVPLFFPWFEMKEYTMPVPDDFVADDDEKELQERFHLSDGQLVWRRWCIQTNCGGSLDKFHQEYPATPHEAFIASGRPVFDTKLIDEAMQKAPVAIDEGRVVNQQGFATFRKMYKGYLKVWEWPVDGEEYVIGIDVAKGLENGDYSVMEVFSHKTSKQVAEWHGHIAPDLLGVEADLLGRFYNLALIVPEANNHGISTIDELRRRHYPRLYRRRTVNKVTNRTVEEYGFMTTEKSKALIIDNLGAFLRQGAIRIKSREALDECLTYVLDAKGRANAQEGCYDDRVIACALALYAIKERSKTGRKVEEKPIKLLYATTSKTGY